MIEVFGCKGACICKQIFLCLNLAVCCRNMAAAAPEVRGVREPHGGSDGGGAEEDEGSVTGSEVSSVVNNGSVISTVPDRHGFLGGSQYCPDE